MPAPYPMDFRHVCKGGGPDAASFAKKSASRFIAAKRAEHSKIRCRVLEVSRSGASTGSV